MPESFFILSKDYLELATDEIISLSKMYDRFTKAKVISNLVIIQSKTNWNEIAKRASFVKVSGQVLRKMSGLFLDENNFEVLKVINLSAHYAKTTAAWYERMMANAHEMKEHMGESGFRAWQVYLSGGSQTLLNGNGHVYRVYCQSK